MHYLAYFLQRQPRQRTCRLPVAVATRTGLGLVLETHPAGHSWIPPPGTRKRSPNFLDALRRVPWSQRITAMSASARDQGKITDALLDILAYAA